MSIRTSKAWLPGQLCYEDPSVPTFVELVLLPFFTVGIFWGPFKRYQAASFSQYLLRVKLLCPFLKSTGVSKEVQS